MLKCYCRATRTFDFDLWTCMTRPSLSIVNTTLHYTATARQKLQQNREWIPVGYGKLARCIEMYCPQMNLKAGKEIHVYMMPASNLLPVRRVKRSQRFSLSRAISTQNQHEGTDLFLLYGSDDDNDTRVIVCNREYWRMEKRIGSRYVVWHMIWRKMSVSR